MNKSVRTIAIISALGASVLTAASTLKNPDIAAAVERELMHDAWVEAERITTTVDDGVATLTGEVDSVAERDLAEKITGSILGVRAVDNQLEIDFTEFRLDEAIQADIEQSYVWDREIPSYQIDVEVEEGNVFLTGEVFSLSAKLRAVKKASIAGTRLIDASGLGVNPLGRAIAPGDRLSEADIVIAVSHQLEANLWVDADEVAVSLNDGVVTLSGVVASISEKRAAARCALGVSGVRGVENQLQIDMPGRTDSELEAAAKAQLDLNPVVESYEISVQVEDGRARLEGEVRSYFEKTQADDSVALVPGIRRIENTLLVENAFEPLIYNVQVSPYAPTDYPWYRHQPTTPKTSDAKIAEAIGSELYWSPFVDREDVSVIVQQGVATLKGSVDSITEFEAATENAYEGGAVRVDNQLTVVR